MELKDMSIEQLEARKAEIVGMLDNDDTNLDELEVEMRSIKAELEARAQIEAEKAELRKAIANDAVEAPVIQEFKEEKREMKTNEEIRASKEYVDAYARYLVTENDAECRSLLTENASGSVPVPVMVDEIIRTAWDENDILSRVKKTYIRGNLKVAFELSADGAYVHAEGTTAPTEESLTFGIVTMVPANVKKWIDLKAA